MENRRIRSSSRSDSGLILLDDSDTKEAPTRSEREIERSSRLGDERVAAPVTRKHTRMYDPESAPGERDFLRLLTSPQYEELREKLIRIFARRGCIVPEDLADETFARVMEKLPQIGAVYEGDPARYVYGVARNVFFEYTRRPPTVSFEENRGVPERVQEPELGEDEAQECLERCLGELSPDERHLIKEYYRYEKGAKIAHRRDLARTLGLGLNALRIKAFRIRKRIHDCISACVEARTNGGQRRDTDGRTGALPTGSVHRTHRERP